MAHFVARFVHQGWGAYSGKRTGVQFSTTDQAEAATYKCTAAYNNSL